MRHLSVLFVWLSILLYGCSSNDEDLSSPEGGDQSPNPNQYVLTVTAGEGGSVSTQGGTYDEGTEITVTATPGNNFIFSSWEGNSSNESTITVTMNSNITLKALFEFDCDSVKITPVNYLQPSYFTGIFNSLGSESLSEIIGTSDGCDQGYLVEYVIFDYNGDGYNDLIYLPNDYENRDNRQRIEFYIGDCDGKFNLDSNNDNIYGLVHSRKILLGDFNSDGFVDVFLIGHGWDRDDFPGEYPVLLLGSANGVFLENRLTNYVGYFHGGSSGDFDNDGDLDIILNTTRLGNNQFTFLVNDGSANFSENNNLGVYLDPFLGSFVNSEMFDLNHDNNLDIFLMNEVEIDNMDNVSGRNYYSEMLFGNGNDFEGDRINIPRVSEGTEVSPYYTVYDIDFYDLDSDGQEEIIINRTTENYRGWYIQIVKFENNQFIDVTDSFIENNKNSEDNFITYMEIREINGEVVLRTGRLSNCNDGDTAFHSWKLIGDKLIRQ